MNSKKVEQLHPSRTQRGITPATKFATLIGDYGTSDFVMKRGGRLPEITIAYESWGTLSPNYDNAILIFTGLSPSAHAASSPEDPEPGWWEFMIGPGKAIDTDRFFVICVNSLGGCFGSTGPESINPETGHSYGSDFPELTIEDIAKAGHHLLHELGIDHLHAVIGPTHYSTRMNVITWFQFLPHRVRYHLPSQCDRFKEKLFAVIPTGRTDIIILNRSPKQA